MSNSDSLNSENYNANGVYASFDHLILSHKIGIIKPDPRIYQYALEKLKLPAGSCLFIDDAEPCVKGAREQGMHAIQFAIDKQPLDCLISQLRNYGIRL